MVLLYLRADLFKAVDPKMFSAVYKRAQVPGLRTPQEQGVFLNPPKSKQAASPEMAGAVGSDPRAAVERGEVRAETQELAAPPKQPVYTPAVEGKPEHVSPAAIHASPGQSLRALPVEHPLVQPIAVAEGVTTPQMRVRPRGARSTGSAVPRREMEEVQSRITEPHGYKCRGKGCDAFIVAPDKGSATPSIISDKYSKFRGEPPGTLIPLENDSLSHEHYSNEKCPSCLAAENSPKEIGRAVAGSPEQAKEKATRAAMTKHPKLFRSMEMLDQMMKLSKGVTVPSEGEDFGKPASSVSEEISHLIKEKDYPQKRAVAAALSMERRGDFGKKKKVEKSLFYLAR
jgi:hypothetical protein